MFGWKGEHDALLRSCRTQRQAGQCGSPCQRRAGRDRREPFATQEPQALHVSATQGGIENTGPVAFGLYCYTVVMLGMPQVARFDHFACVSDMETCVNVVHLRPTPNSRRHEP